MWCFLMNEVCLFPFFFIMDQQTVSWQNPSWSHQSDISLAQRRTGYEDICPPLLMYISQWIRINKRTFKYVNCRFIKWLDQFSSVCLFLPTLLNMEKIWFAVSLLALIRCDKTCCRATEFVFYFIANEKVVWDIHLFFKKRFTGCQCECCYNFAAAFFPLTILWLNNFVFTQK